MCDSPRNVMILRHAALSGCGPTPAWLVFGRADKATLARSSQAHALRCYAQHVCHVVHDTPERRSPLTGARLIVHGVASLLHGMTVFHDIGRKTCHNCVNLRDSEA
jgi:hypothetical protein